MRVVFYFSWLFPVYLTLFCTIASLKVLSMNVLDSETEDLNTEILLQHTALHLLFCSASKSLDFERNQINTLTEGKTHQCGVFAPFCSYCYAAAAQNIILSLKTRLDKCYFRRLERRTPEYFGNDQCLIVQLFLCRRSADRI